MMTIGLREPTRREGADALYATGHWLFQQGRHEDAASVFRAMLVTAPQDERAWLALGACHEALRQPEKALEIFAAGELVARPAPRCALARATCLRSMDRLDEAAESLTRALELARERGDEELVSLLAAAGRVS